MPPTYRNVLYTVPVLKVHDESKKRFPPKKPEILSFSCILWNSIFRILRQVSKNDYIIQKVITYLIVIPEIAPLHIVFQDFTFSQELYWRSWWGLTEPPCKPSPQLIYGSRSALKWKVLKTENSRLKTQNWNQDAHLCSWVDDRTTLD
jgi:hypothetical protein